MLAIIDYEMGNLRSVQKAFERLGAEAVITDSPAELAQAPAMVLPGVGAFRDAIAALKHQDLVGPIEEHIAADRPGSLPPHKRAFCGASLWMTPRRSK